VDPLGGTLFALVHFCVFRPLVTTHLTCVYLSLANDTHVVNHALDVVLAILRL
jgi:hypothetical protein